MSVTRRCFLKFTCGAAAGTLISPLPWKLLDDAAIWTQNGSWVAQTPRGPVSSLFSTCTLCGAGCGLRLRQVGSDTVSVQGVSGHPVSQGALCPAGLGLAQILHHPARVRGAMKRDRSATAPWHPMDTTSAYAEVGRKLAELRAAGRSGEIAILDLRPGRSLSVLYRNFLATAGAGRYLTLPDGRQDAATALAELAGVPRHAPGYDFAHAGAVISFGAPVFDGWCGAGPAPGLIPATGGTRPVVVQASSNASPTTNLADVWLPLRPGTETALALGLAHLLRTEWTLPFTEEPWPGYNDQVSQHTPRRVADITGLSPALLQTTARSLSGRGPVLAVGGGAPGAGPLGQAEELAIWALNLTLGNLGQAGGVVFRPDLPWSEAAPVPGGTTSLREVPDGSLDLLLVDGSLPDSPVSQALLRRKMRPQSGLIVGLSAFTVGPVAEADLILPAAGPGEWLQDVTAQALAPRTSYALARADAGLPAFAAHPAAILERLARTADFPTPASCGPDRHEEVVTDRLQSLLSQGTGHLVSPDGTTRTPVNRVASLRTFRKALLAGDCWIAPPAPARPVDGLHLTGGARPLFETVAAAAPGRLVSESADPSACPVTLMFDGQVGIAGGGALPPVVNKLRRESNFLPAVDAARVNPDFARQNGWHAGQPLTLTTKRGAWPVTLVLDETVQPGVVLLPAGPGPTGLGDPDDLRTHIIDICSGTDDPVWRVGPAALRKV